MIRRPGRRNVRNMMCFDDILVNFVFLTGFWSYFCNKYCCIRCPSLPGWFVLGSICLWRHFLFKVEKLNFTFQSIHPETGHIFSFSFSFSFSVYSSLHFKNTSLEFNRDCSNATFQNVPLLETGHLRAVYTSKSWSGVQSRLQWRIVWRPDTLRFYTTPTQLLHT